MEDDLEIFRLEDELKMFRLEDDLKNYFKISFGVFLGSPTNIIKQVNSNSWYFTTFQGFGVGGCGGKYKNKANSVSLQLKFHV